MYKEYNFFDPDDMNRENLTKDGTFISDARTMLQEREDYSDAELDTVDKIYDAWLEHFRVSDVNEITALRDLRHVQTGTTEQKARFGRLMDLYETSKGESFFDKDISVGLRKAGDYLEGLATAPSTAAGVFTGGYGKIAAQGGIQATKIGIKEILKNIAKAGVKTAALEGAVGVVHGGIKEGTRVVSGIETDFDYLEPVKVGALSAGGGFILGGVTRAATIPFELRALKRQERASGAIKLRETEAKKVTDEVLKGGSKKKIKAIKEDLDAVNILKDKVAKKKPLDPEKVQKGQTLKEDLSDKDTSVLALSPDVIKNVTAAVLRVGRDVVKQKPGERITTAIHRAIVQNKVEIRDITKVLDEHNITLDQFSLIYKADVSAAAKLLGEQSLIARTFGNTTTKKQKQIVKELLQDVDKLEKAGVSKVSAKETIEALKENPLLIPYRFVQDLDQFRIGLMTIQPKTTARNTANGGFRVMVDAIDRSMDNVLFNTFNTITRGKTPYRNMFRDAGVLDVAKFLLNPYEGNIIKKVFTDNFPNESRRLFFANADIDARTGGDGFLANIGRKLNFLNTASDNMFKRAVLGASLKRRINDSKILIDAKAKKQLIQQRLIQELGPNFRQSPDYTKTVKKLSAEIDKQKFHDLFTLYEVGDFTKIADDVFDGSIKDAYNFTYQTRFDDYGRLGSDTARALIAGHRKIPLVISSMIPFPRFVASQLKFIHEYTPLLGLLPFEKIPNPFSFINPKAKPYNARERLAKTLTGTIILGTAYAWRHRQGDTNHWYEFRDNDGKIADGRPLYGPFAPFMLYADMIYRYKNNQLASLSWQRYTTDILQALFGSTFRTGLGIYSLDKLFNDLAETEGTGTEKTNRLVGEVIGNLLKTLSIPVAVVRDLYSQFDVKSSYVPETTTRGESTDIFDIIVARGTSNLPDFGENTPFIGKKGFLKIDALADKLNLKYDSPAYSPFQTGPLQYQDPLEGQIRGIAKRPKKNRYQEELGKLNMMELEIYKRHPNVKTDYLTRFYLQEKGSDTNLNERMTQVINSKKYQDAPYDTKRSILYYDSKRIIERARAKALGEIKETEASKTNKNYTTFDLQKWERTNQRDKDAVNAFLKQELKKYGFDDFKTVSVDKNKTVNIKGKEYNILILGNQTLPQIKKGVLGGGK